MNSNAHVEMNECVVKTCYKTTRPLEIVIIITLDNGLAFFHAFDKTDILTIGLNMINTGTSYSGTYGISGNKQWRSHLCK